MLVQTFGFFVARKVSHMIEGTDWWGEKLTYT